MSFFQEEYKKSLQELKLKLSQETNIEKRQLIISDIDYIMSLLYGFKSKQNTSVGKTFEEKNQFLGFYRFHDLKNCEIGYLRKICINDKINKLMKTITEEFINVKLLKLKEVYDRINSYNGIRYECPTSNNRSFAGATIYIQSLDKNYIKILTKNDITDYSTLIHELAHAKVNMINKNIAGKQNFKEVYPNFLELVFADFLKSKNLLEFSYNLKLDKFKNLKNLLNEINKEKEEYIYRDYKDNKVNDYFFEYKYRVVRDTFVAFKLYDMYLSNPNKVLGQMDIFISNLKTMNEEELLKIFNLDNSIFENNEIFYDMIEKIKKEKKEKILSRIKFK